MDDVGFGGGRTRHGGGGTMKERPFPRVEMAAALVVPLRLARRRARMVGTLVNCIFEFWGVAWRSA